MCEFVKLPELDVLIEDVLGGQPPQSAVSAVDGIAELYSLTKDDADGMLEDVKIEKKYAKPVSKAGKRSVHRPDAGATGKDIGVFGQTVFRKATGTKQ